MRLAATVMLVRPAEGAGGFDVFMLRRSAQSVFVPDVYVFPGGTLDPQDSSPEARARTRGLEGSGVRDAYRAQGAGLMVTALRELFEEAGVLLACDANGRPLGHADLSERAQRLVSARQSLQSGEMAFADILAQLDLYADASALTLFSRWITPPSEPRRYDAYFFIARASRDQVARADARETHDGVWIAPREALERRDAESFRLVYPTVKHLERLAAFRDADALLEFARSKPIFSIMPQGTPERGFSIPAELEHTW